MSSNKPPLILILGPTAVGKTEISVQLAEKLNGEIISADSRLFYRGMDIGTAKPTREELSRVPHHLIDIAEPDQTLSLQIFQESARSTIARIHADGHIPFLVGGTGQYLRSVTEGWLPPEVMPNPRLRNVLEKMGKKNGSLWLHDNLTQVDPDAAENIDPRNLRRVIRAFEVIFSSGIKFSDQRKRGDPAYWITSVGLTRPRDVLYRRIDARIELMFANGLMDEVKGLLEKGYSPDLPSMTAIGYRECIMVINGMLSIDQAKTQMKRVTRKFVRRQANWFKENNTEIKWFDLETSRVEVIEEFIRNSLPLGA